MIQKNTLQPALVTPWSSISGLTAGAWVKLLQPLSEYCHDEALLLCPASEDQWSVWIPDHGEAILNKYQFYTLA